jgi:hypothetical protein
MPAAYPIRITLEYADAAACIMDADGTAQTGRYDCEDAKEEVSLEGLSVVMDAAPFTLRVASESESV